MDRKAIAKETLTIMKNGYYEVNGRKTDIQKLQEYSVKESILLTPEQGNALIERDHSSDKHLSSRIEVWNCSTVEAILRLTDEGKKPSVLNFASAKNPGGGFIGGANAQEESLAASSCLYKTLVAHPEYYERNRACKTMIYTDHAIYSPDVVFFRDERFHLIERPVTASVLTIPAVNMGQVIQKGENIEEAEKAMKNRMKLLLAIFAQQGCKHLILGAYGCGVFRNDPEKIAKWWKELLENIFPESFETIIFAVLDHSAAKKNIAVFEQLF